ncbi:uncharacterized protein AB675_6362 [Cyphellophora attinorum]|uniref:Uncharacterized protein n=1 Tax=Cyphellophora attinorum TaxID=1664694 RepID=A0A0N1HED0_9EURO|nr:uncharacterized protein AB675_6362 [Phialophora attinorum]KPI43747.1 hypothetical protein AB675_6362 [Phialophora attinorum]
MPRYASPSAASHFMRRCRRQLTTTAENLPYNTTASQQQQEQQQPQHPINVNIRPSQIRQTLRRPPLLAIASCSGPSNLPEPDIDFRRTKRPHAGGALSPMPGILNLSQPKAQAAPGTRVPPPLKGEPSFFRRIGQNIGLISPKAAADIPQDPFNVWNNPYRTHKSWPPNFKALEHTQQLAFEKIYKRRIALKWERKEFKRYLSLIQNGLIIGFVFFMVWIYDLEEGTPFDGLRAWLWRHVGEMEMFPERVREDAKKKNGEYSVKWQKIKDSFTEITPQEGMIPGGDPRQIVNPEDEKIPWAQRQRSRP